MNTEKRSIVRRLLPLWLAIIILIVIVVVAK